MAKARSGRAKQGELAPIKMVEPVPVGPEMAEQAVALDEPVRYAFKTVVRCPRCGTTDTVARSTKGRVQYRMCRRATCQYGEPGRGLGLWKVSGTPA